MSALECPLHAYHVYVCMRVQYTCGIACSEMYAQITGSSVSVSIL